MSFISFVSPYGMPGVDIEIMPFSMPSLSMNSRAEPEVQLIVPQGRCKPVSSADGLCQMRAVRVECKCKMTTRAPWSKLVKI